MDPTTEVLDILKDLRQNLTWMQQDLKVPNSPAWKRANGNVDTLETSLKKFWNDVQADRSKKQQGLPVAGVVGGGANNDQRGLDDDVVSDVVCPVPGGNQRTLALTQLEKDLYTRTTSKLLFKS